MGVGSSKEVTRAADLLRTYNSRDRASNYRKTGYSCIFPDRFCKLFSAGDLISNEHFVLVHRIEGMHRRRHEPHSLYVFHRLTRCWCGPIEFDPGEQTLNARLLGFAGPRTFVLLWSVLQLTNGEHNYHLIWIDISPALDALTVCKHRVLGPEFRPYLELVGFFAGPDRLRIVFESAGTGRLDGRYVLVYKETATGEIDQYEVVDDMSCKMSMVHDGQLYLLCSGRYGEYSLYECTDGGMQLVTRFDSSPPFTRPGPTFTYYCTCDSRLFMLLWYEINQRMVTHVFDVAQRQWLEPYSAKCFRLGRDPFNGWMKMPCQELLFRSGGESGLLSVWLNPPTLTQIALHVVHKYMPDGTASTLANTEGICSVEDLIVFLFRESSLQ